MIPSRSFLTSAVALLASTAIQISNVAAQVTTDCQPLDKECPPNPAFSMAHTFNFNSTPAAWDTVVRPVTYDNTNGATFTVNQQGDSPTIRTKYYIFFGRVELIMKAARGTGIISSVMLLSSDLDEIDIEFLGANTTHVSTNYFGKGRDDFTKGAYHAVPGGTQANFKNYTIVWTKERLDFFVEGALARTILPKDANNTNNYPQTPCRLSIGIWAGGDPRLPEGTRQWAGGDTDYSKGPYSMFVKSARVEDFGSGKEYVYGDRSGSWQSIKVVSGESTANATVNVVPQVEKSISDRWNELSSTAKIGIYAGAGGFVALIVGLMLFYCIKQRRRGAQEAKLAEQRENKERMELEQYHKAGINPDAFVVANSEYNADAMKRDVTHDGGGYSIPGTPVNPDGPLSEKSSWGGGHNPAAGAAALAAAGGMRSPVPLLRDGASSPRVGSPAPQGGGAFGGGAAMRPGLGTQESYRSTGTQDSYRSGGGGGGTAPLISPMRTNSPGMPPSYPLPNAPRSPAPGNRSFTAPTPRMGSPGPQAGGGYGSDMRMMNSPGPVGPQRSFTNDPYQRPGGGGGGYGGNGGYGGRHGGDDGYWR